jgi:protein TonB
MPTEQLPTRRPQQETPTERLSRGLGLAIGLHVLVFGGIIVAAIVANHQHRWGEQDPMAGAIQASMVNALPLPPRVPVVDKAVLASETPNIAPTRPPPEPEMKAKPESDKPKAEPPPKPIEILIPQKAAPVKETQRPVEREQPTPARRPLPPPPPTPKATTGETGGMQIPQSVTQLKNGTASVSVQDRAFGDRYAYYIRLISQKINESKAQEQDGPETRGKRAMISFTIDRDGTPQDIQVDTRSGSTALDQSTLRAIQRIDTFGPLPAGDRLPVVYIWDSK